MGIGSINHGSASDYIDSIAASYAPSASLLDGAPSTANAYSRYQWSMRQLLEGDGYTSHFSDAPDDVIVAVIGQWPGHQNHPNLVNRYVGGFNLVEGGTNTSATWDGNAATASNSHDQAVASIIAAEHGATGMAGVFHRAKILPIRASFQTLGQAIDLAVANGAKVIHIAGFVVANYNEGFLSWLDDLWPNYPLYPAFKDGAHRAGNLPAMLDARRAIADAAEAKVLITTVIANKVGCPTWTLTSCMPETIVAGPSNVLGEISPHSSFSYAFDVFAPGGDRRAMSASVSYPSNVVVGDATANGDDPMVCVGPDKYSFLTLGSAAGPHVAGACAIIKSYLPNATVEEARRLIQKSSNTPTPTLNILQACGGILSLKRLRSLLHEEARCRQP